MSEDRVFKPLHAKIDEGHKLTLQVFPRDRFLVLNGAGGGVACAAYLSLAEHPDIVVDQTLYWTVVPTEAEAWYRVGLINSDALTEAVREFNPEGELGPRHLHTLPNRVIPPFDPHNRGQLHIAVQDRQLSVQAQQLLAANAMIADPSRPIAARRRLIRNALKGLPEYARLENACEAILRCAI